MGYLKFVTRIGDNAFKNCSKLKSVQANNLVQIGKSAYAGCSSLKSFTFTYVKTIGEKAFAGCPFGQLTLGSSLQSIGSKTFQGAFKNGGHIYVHSSAPTTSQNAFEDAKSSSVTLHVDA